MENKRSFVLYVDTIHVVKKLPDETAGKLLKLILSYVNDEDPIVDDLMLDIVFEPIKQQLKRDLKKWDVIREKRSNAGKASANKRQQKATHVDTCGQMSTENVNVNVNVNDNVINKNQSKIDVAFLLNHFNQTFSKRSRIIPDKVLKSYQSRIKEGYLMEEITSAMTNASRDKFHIENQFTHCTLEFFSRAEKIDKFANTSIKQNQKYIPTK
jgi:hypothetical protein